MRSVNLLKVAAAAETLRYCCTLARQGRRAAFGASALLPLRSCPLPAPHWLLLSLSELLSELVSLRRLKQQQAKSACGFPDGGHRSR